MYILHPLRNRGFKADRPAKEPVKLLQKGYMNRQTKLLQTMFTMKNEAYETPMLEVVAIAVEQGFNVSGGGTIDEVPSDQWGDY